MNDLNLKQPQKIAAVIFLAAFFLPWINIMGLIQLSGYNLPSAISGLAQMGNAFSEGTEQVSVIQYYLVYLIPLAAITTILTKKRSRVIEVVPVVMVFLGLGYLVADGNIDSEAMQFVGIGAYGTIFAAIMAAASIFSREEKGEPEVASEAIA
jgi:hypothetical protein